MKETDHQIYNSVLMMKVRRKRYLASTQNGLTLKRLEYFERSSVTLMFTAQESTFPDRLNVDYLQCMYGVCWYTRIVTIVLMFLKQATSISALCRDTEGPFMYAEMESGALWQYNIVRRFPQDLARTTRWFIWGKYTRFLGHWEQVLLWTSVQSLAPNEIENLLGKEESFAGEYSAVTLIKFSSILGAPDWLFSEA